MRKKERSINKFENDNYCSRKKEGEKKQWGEIDWKKKRRIRNKRLRKEKILGIKKLKGGKDGIVVLLRNKIKKEIWKRKKDENVKEGKNEERNKE